jgi:hypothetical protein
MFIASKGDARAASVVIQTVTISLASDPDGFIRIAWHGLNAPLWLMTKTRSDQRCQAPISKDLIVDWGRGALRPSYVVDRFSAMKGHWRLVGEGALPVVLVAGGRLSQADMRFGDRIISVDCSPDCYRSEPV